MNVNIHTIISQRFDLLAKYIYVKYKELNISTEFHKEIYREHIRTFNNFTEVDNNKNNVKDFFNIFDELIESMKKNGFDKKYPIPLGSNKILENGAHRLMTSIYLNIKPEFNILNKNIPDFYNYEFFLQRERNPLSRRYADFMALEGVKLNSNIRSMTIYPNICSKRSINIIKNIIKTYGIIYYEKQVKLNDNGLLNLIKEQYRGEDWIGGLFPNSDYNCGKFQRCKGRGNTCIILFNIFDINKLQELKEKCRNKFKIGKHSLHISDYPEDTFRISSSLLNENSIYYLNKGTYNFSENTKKLLRNYFEKVKSDESFCLTSSIAMELFGLRNCNDLDYLNKENYDLSLDNTSQHKDIWLTYYTKNVDNIVYNPDNHFYFNGHKLISLDILKNMKKNRGEEKDLRDLELIKNHNL